jgi:hypothetical protein
MNSKMRARRRVKTPPGAQAQASWAKYPRVVIARDEVDLYAFGVGRSYSRRDPRVWSLRKSDANDFSVTFASGYHTVLVERASLTQASVETVVPSRGVIEVSLEPVQLQVR